MERFSPDDIRRLATLQCQCIPDSLVSQLGRAYSESFYRYATRSPREKVLVLRDAGQIVSACVLTLDPGTLRRRLLLHTPVALYAGPWLLRGLLHRRPKPAAAALPRDPVPADLPELLLLFTSPEARSRGLGAVLVGQADDSLRAAGCRAYLVRTQDQPGNRALKFYEACGFKSIGRTSSHGEVFRVFSKTL